MAATNVVMSTGFSITLPGGLSQSHRCNFVGRGTAGHDQRPLSELGREQR